jgi:acryloyl-coenzyme A reductase
MHSARPGGRIVVLGNVEGGTAQIRPALMILKELAVLGTKSVTRAEMQDVVDAVSAGRFEVGASVVRPLSDAMNAHAEMESGRTSGRTVLTMTD